MVLWRRGDYGLGIWRVRMRFVWGLNGIVDWNGSTGAEFEHAGGDDFVARLDTG